MRKITQKILIILIGLSPMFTLQGQNLNDICLGATELTNLDNWCSSVGAYNNNLATPSLDEIDVLCWPEIGNDIWLSFTAEANSLSVSVEGKTSPNPGGSLVQPQMVVYSGFCGSLTELSCISDAFTTNVVETQIQNLVPGQKYFIRISARNDNTGSFKLCINNFNAVPDPNGDCSGGVILCDKSSFTVPSVFGEGSNPNELQGLCLGNEFSSSWYKWTCEESGSLTFTLNPLVSTDDLDFAVFEMPNGIDDCSNLELLRCMASGENVGAPLSDWISCIGATGLSAGSDDIVETPGCSNNDDNFLEPLAMEAGKSYALVVNNFTNNGNGYSIEFGGTGSFLGPKLDFEIDPEGEVSCDVDIVTFTQNAVIPDGTTATFNWYFGQGANPATAIGPGPHEVVYESFGDKSVLLQAETDAGCIVTDVTEVPILSCCDPSFNLGITLDEFGDPICFESNTGFINVVGTGGNPFYQFSIDGENFQPVGTFVGLTAGEQTVYIQDIKGCVDSLDQNLVNPPPIIVNAGQDQTINLGESTNLSGLVNAPNPDVTSFSWIITDTLLSENAILNPQAFPVDDTYFYLEAIDDLGCNSRDSVLVVVQKIRPIYTPNIFSPNYDGINDYFTVYGNAAAEKILRLEVYDRWGGLAFSATDLELGAEPMGWNGEINGQKAESGVYVYYAQVEFIDRVVLQFEGSITLIR
jgi:gliding motility-associated-like protein